VFPRLVRAKENYEFIKGKLEPLRASLNPFISMRVEQVIKLLDADFTNAALEVEADIYGKQTEKVVKYEEPLRIAGEGTMLPTVYMRREGTVAGDRVLGGTDVVSIDEEGKRKVNVEKSFLGRVIKKYLISKKGGYILDGISIEEARTRFLKRFALENGYDIDENGKLKKKAKRPKKPAPKEVSDWAKMSPEERIKTRATEKANRAFIRDYFVEKIEKAQEDLNERKARASKRSKEEAENVKSYNLVELKKSYSVFLLACRMRDAIFAKVAQGGQLTPNEQLQYDVAGDVFVGAIEYIGNRTDWYDNKKGINAKKANETDRLLDFVDAIESVRKTLGFLSKPSVEDGSWVVTPIEERKTTTSTSYVNQEGGVATKAQINARGKDVSSVKARKLASNSWDLLMTETKNDFTELLKFKLYTDKKTGEKYYYKGRHYQSKWEEKEKTNKKDIANNKVTIDGESVEIKNSRKKQY